jgi:hypothetical protein
MKIQVPLVVDGELKMEPQANLKEIDSKIRLLKSTAVELGRLGEDMPFLVRNNIRILASIKMMEINLCDLMDLNDGKDAND